MSEQGDVEQLPVPALDKFRNMAGDADDVDLEKEAPQHKREVDVRDMAMSEKSREGMSPAVTDFVKHMLCIITKLEKYYLTTCVQSKMLDKRRMPVVRKEGWKLIQEGYEAMSEFTNCPNTTMTTQEMEEAKQIANQVGGNYWELVRRIVETY